MIQRSSEVYEIVHRILTEAGFGRRRQTWYIRGSGVSLFVTLQNPSNQPQHISIEFCIGGFENPATLPARSMRQVRASLFELAMAKPSPEIDKLIDQWVEADWKQRIVVDRTRDFIDDLFDDDTQPEQGFRIKAITILLHHLVLTLVPPEGLSEHALVTQLRRGLLLEHHFAYGDGSGWSIVEKARAASA